jgi:hypothetical protein
LAFLEVKITSLLVFVIEKGVDGLYYLTNSKGSIDGRL